MNSRIAHASTAAPAAPSRGRPDRFLVLSTAVLFAFGAATAAASDLATPLIGASAYVGAALLALIVVFAALHFRSGAKAHEARMAALALPAALCAWAVFNHSYCPEGQPPSGVLAQTFPALERVQAQRLALRPDVRAALLLEADLKSGGEAAKAAAVGAIPSIAPASVQRYLYETAASFGDGAQKQRVLAALLARDAGRTLAVEPRGEDNLTLQSQYLEGSSIRFETGDGHAGAVTARLTTNKEAVALRGALAGPALTMTGKASVADIDAPLTLDAKLGPGLTLAGDFRFPDAPSVPFVVRVF